MRDVSIRKRLHQHSIRQQDSSLFKWDNLGLVLIVAIVLGWVGVNPPVLAAPKEEPSPLELTEPDPLLPEAFKPKKYKKYPLSASDQATLAAALEQLNERAAAQLAAGNDNGAFDTWNRELRLRRFLGPLLEVKALGRVANIAWEEGRGIEVRVIVKRLREIEAEETKAERLNLPLKQALALAYEQARQREEALKFYQELLALAQEQGDRAQEVTLLHTIANLHITWFYYLDAAETYQQLLAIAEQNGDRFEQAVTLKKLVHAYDQGKLHQDAIAAKQKLEQFYLVGEGISDDPLKAAIPDLEAGRALIPALKLSMGENYEALAQLENAFQLYQEAYSLAWGLQQFSEASTSLRRIISLYLAQEQVSEALQAYQTLLLSDRQGYNQYGQMISYDEIAQIYRDHEEYDQALLMFQQGLELARQLKYRETYFEAQIEQVTQLLSQNSPAELSPESPVPEISDTPTEDEIEFVAPKP